MGTRALLPIQCRVKGQVITRSITSSYWYGLAAGNYVSAAYVSVPSGTKVPTC